MQESFEYPDFIRGLPEIDISLEGVTGWLLQSNDNQVVFFDIEPIGEIPIHSHGSQFGIVLDGEMSLTIGEDTNLFRKGDSYFIPAGVPHGATFHTRFRAIDFFGEPARYKPKT